MSYAIAFTREHLRARLTLVLLVALPATFVTLAAGVLDEFADALGGSLSGDGAASLGAGWSAAFIAGALGFFQIASSRGADRRLALAGLGPMRVALSRLAASIGLAVVASAAAYMALALEAGIEHPWHAAAGILAFALIYLGVGALVGSLVASPLEGSLAVAFVFLLDVFSGPGMSEGEGSFYSVSREAADVLISAAVARGSPGADWVAVASWALGSLGLAFAVFSLTARSRL